MWSLMKVGGSFLVLAILALGLVASASSEIASAAKPQRVIEMSNGYPSGRHFNLNIHGKKGDYTCDPSPGGNSVFIPEYGTSTLQYVSNKKSSVTELKALDPCAEAFDGDPTKVQLPKEDDGYYVFARVRAKPQNGNNAEESSIILVPDPVIEACNSTSTTPEFGDATSCSDDEALLAVKGGEKVYHCGGGIVYHRHDEKGLNWEPGGIRSGAGVRSSGVSQESTGSSDTWEAALCRLCLRR